ncbi:MAG: methyltransferase domain-containing protein [Edaphobacter sp.]|uniref:SAM-dependent methyltransferase n=1 Tax=Edaphobacter sp. TaxID=1934404 RepID=UPI002980D42D|nr:methyltransferase domain-containing protein [Edaphobacter sp.]MDW5267599.1 methyltransferase domain-containing protein [Edaphobacter sp.]
MTDTTTKVREHYRGTDLSDRIRSVLAAITPEGDTLTVAQLAPLDQFHTRGILATTELADAAGLEPSTRVLDLGCGIGGPARYLAATFGCRVTGVDLSPAFIDAASYLTERCGLSDLATFQVGNALDLPFEDAAFDTVFLQHVAMNVDDRSALYAEVRRILMPGGRFAVHDLVLRVGDTVYPVPWARDASTSFLLSEGDTRAALERAGFKAVLWRDDTQAALHWFQAAMTGLPPAGPNLSAVMGPDFPAIVGNLSRNLRENRLGVLSAVLTRD